MKIKTLLFFLITLAIHNVHAVSPFSSNTRHPFLSHLSDDPQVFKDFTFKKKVDRMRDDLIFIFFSINQIFAIEGASVNSDSITDPFVAGVIQENTDFIMMLHEDILQVLFSTNFSGYDVNLVRINMLAFINAALSYSHVKSLNHKGEHGGDEKEAASALYEAFTQFGVIVEGLDGQSEVIDRYQQIAMILMDIPNIFNSDYENSSTEVQLKSDYSRGKRFTMASIKIYDLLFDTFEVWKNIR